MTPVHMHNGLKPCHSLAMTIPTCRHLAKHREGNDSGAGWMDGWVDGFAPTCPGVEGETGFNEIWGVALGAESPYRSAVCAAVRSSRHQFEQVSGG